MDVDFWGSRVHSSTHHLTAMQSSRFHPGIYPLSLSLVALMNCSSGEEYLILINFVFYFLWVSVNFGCFSFIKVVPFSCFLLLFLSEIYRVFCKIVQ